MSTDETAWVEPTWKRLESEMTYEQRELYEAMSDVSETSYCAGWMHGLESAAWELIHEGGGYGLIKWEVGDRELERVRRAMNAAGCWIVWDDDDHGPRPVPLDEWKRDHPVSVAASLPVGDEKK